MNDDQTMAGAAGDATGEIDASDAATQVRRQAWPAPELAWSAEEPETVQLRTPRLFAHGLLIVVLLAAIAVASYTIVVGSPMRSPPAHAPPTVVAPTVTAPPAPPPPVTVIAPPPPPVTVTAEAPPPTATITPEAPAPTTAVPLTPEQKFLADIHAQGWSPPTPEGAIAGGHKICGLLIGPPRRTPAEVEAMVTADPDINFAQAQTLVLISRNDLCPY